MEPQSHTEDLEPQSHPNDLGLQSDTQDLERQRIPNDSELQSNTEDFSFRLHGTGITPDSFNANEVGKLLLNLNALFSTYAEYTSRETIDTGISLVGVQNSSLLLAFRARATVQFTAAFLAITTALSQQDYTRIPTGCIEQLKSIQSLVRSKGCDAQFLKNREEYASINASTTIAVPQTGLLRGETVLYGSVRFVGGKTPRTRIELDTGEVISCFISRQLATGLGKRLYKKVILKGMAAWSSLDYTLLDFKIESFQDYNPLPPATLFAQLSESIGQYWNGIDDPDSYLRDPNID
jgi:hypothetical protein